MTHFEEVKTTLPYLYFGSEDSDGPTPYSWRFGSYRRWHPDLSFLYEIKGVTGRAWASCLRFTEEEMESLRDLPAPQNQTHRQAHKDASGDTESIQ
jgi:hypothetical protein